MTVIEAKRAQQDFLRRRGEGSDRVGVDVPEVSKILESLLFADVSDDLVKEVTGLHYGRVSNISQMIVAGQLTKRDLVELEERAVEKLAQMNPDRRSEPLRSMIVLARQAREKV